MLTCTRYNAILSYQLDIFWNQRLHQWTLLPLYPPQGHETCVCSNDNTKLCSYSQFALTIVTILKMSSSNHITCHNSIILDGPPNNHDSIVKRTFCLFNKLFSTSTEDERTCLSLRASSEDVISVHIQGNIHSINH